MFYTVGTIKSIIGNEVRIRPILRYTFVSLMANEDLMILDNNKDCLIKMIKMKSESKEFKLKVSQDGINILKHLSANRQMGFDIDDNLTDIKAVYYTDE